MTETALQASRDDRAFLGHPKGMAYLAFTEAWERFSYYGMQGLLALYMVQQLLLPGHVENVVGMDPFLRWIGEVYGADSVKAQSSAIFGLYTSLVYVTPLLGGLIADRVLGRTRTIVMGAVVMALGHFLMAFDQSFLLALVCLMFGAGCLKGNIASQVGGLYKAGDNRAADAFQIFYLAINAGAIAAPLVCGTLGQTVGWHWGFGVAGIGMVISLLIYLAGRKHLPPDPNIRGAGATAVPRPGFRKGDALVFAILLILLPVLAVGVSGNQQIFNAYQVWVDETADMTFFGFTVPSTWIQFIDTIASVTFLAGAVVFWRWWATFAKEPTEMTKIGIGSIIAVSGLLCLAAGAYFAQFHPEHKVAFGWLLAFHILNSIGFANVFPVALAFYARCAPPALGATMIGIFYLHLAAANQLVGWLGGQVEKMSMVNFWLIHAAMCGAAGLVFLLLKPLVWPILAPKPTEETASA